MRLDRCAHADLDAVADRAAPSYNGVRCYVAIRAEHAVMTDVRTGHQERSRADHGRSVASGMDAGELAHDDTLIERRRESSSLPAPLARSAHYRIPAHDRSLVQDRVRLVNIVQV
jgi:hypothetical protein